MKEALEIGSKHILKNKQGEKEYIIKEVIGEGASCIVYDGYYYDELGIKHDARIKECIPLGIHRDGNTVVWDDDVRECALTHFNNTYKKQLYFQHLQEFNHSTAHIIDSLYEGNNTKYIILDYDYAHSYNKVEEDIESLIKHMLALSKLIYKYHKQGYLLMDIKPENFLVIDETDELVYYIDFDSIRSIEYLQDHKEDFSFSREYAAPEVKMGKVNKISYHSDIYAVGKIIYNKLFHETLKQHQLLVGIDYHRKLENINIHPKAKMLLSEVLEHTLQTNTKRRYQTIDEVINKLDEIVSLFHQKHYILSNLPIQDNYFTGRKEELIYIHNKFKQSNQIFISGIGGIGKTELSKRYVFQYKEHYHTIVYLNYKTSIKDTLTQIKLKDGYKYELDMLKSIVDNQTLLVLDNYDKLSDDSYLFLSLPCKKIITTRLSLKDIIIDDKESIYYPIQALNKEECIDLFHHYYKDTTQDEYINKIIEHVDGYTLVVALISKQLKVSDITPKQFYHVLINNRFKDIYKERVTHSKDNTIQSIHVKEHITQLFDIFKLDIKERKVLYVLSLLGSINIDRKLLALLSRCLKEGYCIENNYFQCNILEGIEETKEYTDLNIIWNLIEKGWIYYDEIHNSVSMHSMIQEVVCNSVDLNIDDLSIFKSIIKEIVMLLYYSHLYMSVDINTKYEYYYKNTPLVEIRYEYLNLILEFYKHIDIYQTNNQAYLIELSNYMYFNNQIDIVNDIYEEIYHHIEDKSLLNCNIALMKLTQLDKQSNGRNDDHLLQEVDTIINRQLPDDVFDRFKYISRILLGLYYSRNLLLNYNEYCLAKFSFKYIDLLIDDYHQLIDHDILSELLLDSQYTYDKFISRLVQYKHYVETSIKQEIQQDTYTRKETNYDFDTSLVDKYTVDIDTLEKTGIKDIYKNYFHLLISNEVTEDFKEENLSPGFSDTISKLRYQSDIQLNKQCMQYALFIQPLCNSFTYVSLEDYEFKHDYYTYLTCKLKLLEHSFNKKEKFVLGGFGHGSYEYNIFAYDNHLLGYDEFSMILFSKLSNSYYNIENYNLLPKNDFLLEMIHNFPIHDFYETYMYYASLCNDEYSYKEAYNTLQTITRNHFSYETYEVENKVNSKQVIEKIKYWIDIIDNMTSTNKASIIQQDINQDDTLPKKYKDKLIQAVIQPLSMQECLFIESYGHNAYKHALLYPACIDIPPIHTLNQAQKMYYYTNALFSSLNNDMFTTYHTMLKDLIVCYEDYQGCFDYLSLQYFNQLLQAIDRCIEYIDIDKQTKIIELCSCFEKQLHNRYLSFDYHMMKYCFYPIKTIFQYLNHQDKINELERYKEYLDKTYIGDKHIAICMQDINVNDLEGKYSRKRQQQYIKQTNQIIEQWKDEEHTYKQYQDKFQEIYNECFKEDNTDEYISKHINSYLKAYLLYKESKEEV